MAIKRRRITLTAVAGSASGALGLGAKYGKVLRVETVATGGDSSSDLAIVDAGSRAIFSIASIDFTSAKKYPLVVEAAFTEDGTAADANETSAPVIAQSPLTVTLANAGTNVQVVDVFVEV
jgi:hypothetical protein